MKPGGPPGVFDYDLEVFAPDGLKNPDTIFLGVEPTKAIHALEYGAGGVQRWQRQT